MAADNNYCEHGGPHTDGPCRLCLEDRQRIKVTDDMRLAVKREGCMAHGHSYNHVQVVHTLAPQHVVCSNCGSSWRIHPDDVRKNF